MIFDSLGLGEIGVIVAAIVIFIDPKKVGQAGRAFAQFRRKWSNIQREVTRQFNEVIEVDLVEKPRGPKVVKAALRKESRETLRNLTSAERSEAAIKILESLKEWSVFQSSKSIAAFCGTLEEVDTEQLIRTILTEKKEVLLPYIKTDSVGKPIIAMAAIKDFENDLREGEFGILEPREELRQAEILTPELVFVPGLLFDENGGRIGHGKGLYDRYLKDSKALKIGLAFEAQVARKKLTLEEHDQILDGLVTERRRLTFSQPRKSVINL